jgi:hypothetical protein
LYLNDILVGVLWREDVALGPGETRHVQVPWTPLAGGRELTVKADDQSVELPYVYVEEVRAAETPGLSIELGGTLGVIVFALVGLLVTVMTSLAASRYLVRRRNRRR